MVGLRLGFTIEAVQVSGTLAVGFGRGVITGQRTVDDYLVAHFHVGVTLGKGSAAQVVDLVSLELSAAVTVVRDEEGSLLVGVVGEVLVLAVILVHADNLTLHIVLVVAGIAVGSEFLHDPGVGFAGGEGRFQRETVMTGCGGLGETGLAVPLHEGAGGQGRESVGGSHFTLQDHFVHPFHGLGAFEGGAAEGLGLDDGEFVVRSAVHQFEGGDTVLDIDVLAYDGFHEVLFVFGTVLGHVHCILNGEGRLFGETVVHGEVGAGLVVTAGVVTAAFARESMNAEDESTESGIGSGVGFHLSLGFGSKSLRKLDGVLVRVGYRDLVRTASGSALIGLHILGIFLSVNGEFHGGIRTLPTDGEEIQHGRTGRNGNRTISVDLAGAHLHIGHIGILGAIVRDIDCIVSISAGAGSEGDIAVHYTNVGITARVIAAGVVTATCSVKAVQVCCTLAGRLGDIVVTGQRTIDHHHITHFHVGVAIGKGVAVQVIDLVSFKLVFRGISVIGDEEGSLLVRVVGEVLVCTLSLIEALDRTGYIVLGVAGIVVAGDIGQNPGMGLRGRKGRFRSETVVGSRGRRRNLTVSGEMAVVPEGHLLGSIVKRREDDDVAGGVFLQFEAFLEGCIHIDGVFALGDDSLAAFHARGNRDILQDDVTAELGSISGEQTLDSHFGRSGSIPGSLGVGITQGGDFRKAVVIISFTADRTADDIACHQAAVLHIEEHGTGVVFQIDAAAVYISDRRTGKGDSVVGALGIGSGTGADLGHQAGNIGVAGRLEGLVGGFFTAALAAVNAAAVHAVQAVDEGSAFAGGFRGVAMVVIDGAIENDLIADLDIRIIISGRPLYVTKIIGLESFERQAGIAFIHQVEGGVAISTAGLKGGLHVGNDTFHENFLRAFDIGPEFTYVSHGAGNGVGIFQSTGSLALFAFRTGLVHGDDTAGKADGDHDRSFTVITGVFVHIQGDGLFFVGGDAGFVTGVHPVGNSGHNPIAGGHKSHNLGGFGGSEIQLGSLHIQ